MHKEEWSKGQAQALKRRVLADAKTEAALWLACCASEGHPALLRYLSRITATEIWTAQEQDLIALGLRPSSARSILEHRRRFALEEMLSLLSRSGAWFIPYGHRLYPVELKQLSHPPAGLFVSGRESEWQQIVNCARITIVGTRQPTPYGLGVAHALGKAFTAAGVVVVSGLARGIDAAVHAACLESGFLGKAHQLPKAPPLAVIGCGPDVFYPVENAGLQRQLAESGCVISEYPPGTRPAPWTFPARNRIMAALGDACLVVEAGAKSGALVTADLSLELGRPVFAVPGRLGSPQSLGCNRLAAEGANLVWSIDECLKEFEGLTRMARGERGICGIRSPDSCEQQFSHKDPLAKLVLEALGGGGKTLEEVACIAGCSAREASALLVRLELEGRVTREGLGLYCLPP